MSWRGFIAESKAFVGYEPGKRLAFWRAFPMAALRFYVLLPLRDIVRRRLARLTGWRARC